MSAIDPSFPPATALSVARARSGAGALIAGIVLVVILGGTALLAPMNDPAAPAAAPALTDWHGNSASAPAPHGAR